VTLFHGVTCARSDTWMPYNPDTTILVGDGVIVAPNSTILVPGGETRVIGDRAIIGANSVVTDDVPAGEIWAGSPARYIRDRRDDE
jgi:serine O-acetyltransferase